MRLAIAAIALSLASTAALSQAASGITAEQAAEIARKNGMATVEEIDRDDGKWEVEGRQDNGREIEIDIDMATGKVIKIDRD